MKKARNILLLVLIMFSMTFTMTVNAEDLGAEPKTVAELTEADFNRIVPNSIDVTMTKTEYAEFTIDNEDLSKKDLLEEEINTKLISLFNDDVYFLESEDITVAPFLIAVGYGNGEIEKANILINSFSKTITINFTKESNYSAEDETYVKNALNNFKFAKYKNAYSNTEHDAVFTMYNIDDENGFNEWTPDTYDFNKLLNDSSITTKKRIASGLWWGSTPWGLGNAVYFYKNDVLYATKFIYNLAAYGTTLDNGTPINMAKLDEEFNKEIYEEMAKEMNNRGFDNIIGAYEITAYGTTSDSMKVSFTLGTDYNGKEVQILHKKSDNTYEIFTTTVENGKATITVNEFSPFMIALGNNNNSTNVEPSNVNVAPNNAQTSSIDVVLYSILAIGSLLGITYIAIKNRKKVA
ncbi:MAG: hypothetical protein LBM96_07030 [Methanobrevibacter sp.]|nr:hypothetical protein [Candidatus Methanoflexus mossambicus]